MSAWCRWRLPVFVTLLLTMVWWPRPMDAATVEITEGTAISAGTVRIYAVQHGARNVASEAPGKTWYTASDAGGVGLVTVASGADDQAARYRVEFYGLGENSRPYDLDIANGAVWFSLQGMSALGRLDISTRDIRVYPLPTSDSAPTGIDVAPDGQVWIAVAIGRLVRFDPDTEAFTEYVFLPDRLLADPWIEDIVYQNSRAIWFTMPDANRVIYYNSVTDRSAELPTGDERPTGISLDKFGRAWITASGSGRVGVYAPGTLTRWEYYNTSSPASEPAGIATFERDGLIEVWYGEGGTGLAGRLVLRPAFEVARRNAIPLGGGTGEPWGVAVAADQHVWLADRASNVLYELVPPYSYQLYSPFLAR